ncbi:DUF885 domain-containing protein [Amycolatopsis albispora]|uniref:DUF885 domain-containing protein n=1 Tax=Amycolatopsis albispora TaxID=1804986 RepID=A0A344L5Q5_9PSEU|nr:DUF885 domain-containing protein [Amycolatopsis albispora]AXB43379.1 hypothetical protein A4R43_13150 [Amycolatopsis albispora]
MASPARAIRDLADAYSDDLADLNPIIGTMTGLRPGDDRLPDFSPDGQQARDDLDRRTLAAVGGTSAPEDDDERRCARLLRERLSSNLAVSEAGEHLRDVSNIFGPVHVTRLVFTMMPTATDDDWAVIARRMANVPAALAGYTESLRTGAERGLTAAPRQVRTLAGQLADWSAVADGRGWFAGLAAKATVPDSLRGDLDRAADQAGAAVRELGGWLSEDYLPRTEGTPDGVGEERYRVAARQWTGSNLDPREAYDWGWAEFHRLREEITEEASRVLPGASIGEAMAHLNEHGERAEGVPAILARLQGLMDEAIRDLDGTHFDLAGRIRRVEAHEAPPGSAAAPYYVRPDRSFTRPGRTYLPTLGRTSFPVWSLISTWYHEGVPGHHLQMAQWAHLADRLSAFQAGIGQVSACTEGWALYAERLMDELGYLRDPGARLGYLEAQLMRAIRVIIDIGMHLGLPIPGDSPVGAGQHWTPDLGRALFAAHSSEPDSYIDSEITRYLSRPGQAISYKLGERAWLDGREAARKAKGEAFDAKSWHMAALSAGSLGLDDLAAELATL